MRVAFVPRSAEIKPLFWRFVSTTNSSPLRRCELTGGMSIVFISPDLAGVRNGWNYSSSLRTPVCVRDEKRNGWNMLSSRQPPVGGCEKERLEYALKSPTPRGVKQIHTFLYVDIYANIWGSSKSTRFYMWTNMRTWPSGWTSGTTTNLFT
jgi:hypothetical protein